MKINSEHILFTRTGDEGVVFDTESNKYFALNETFIDILERIKEGQNEQTIVAGLCEEYDIPEAVCKSEVQQALKVLAEKRFII